MFSKILGLVPFILIAYVYIRYREQIHATIKKLTPAQIVKVIALYLVAIIVGTILIFFMGNWIVQFIPNKSLRFFSQIGIIIGSFYLIIPTLQKLIHKVTNGIISYNR